MFDATDYALATWCAPLSARPSLRTLFALDARLQAIMPSAREPMLGAIKLAWWREQLAALDDGATPAEPMLQQVATVLRSDVTGTILSALATEEPRLAVLCDVVTRLCVGDARAARLLQRLGANDRARMTAGQPLASPARRALMAAQIRLLGR